MIIKLSQVLVLDNTGAVKGICLTNRVNYIGDIIRVSVRYSQRPTRKLLIQGRLQRGLILWQRFSYTRDNTGIRLHCPTGAICLLNSFSLPIANRIKGIVFSEIRHVCLKVLSLADVVI